MYSEMSRHPTAMTFRFPEGATLRFEAKAIHIQILEIFLKLFHIPGCIKKYTEPDLGKTR